VKNTVRDRIYRANLLGASRRGRAGIAHLIWRGGAEGATRARGGGSVLLLSCIPRTVTIVEALRRCGGAAHLPGGGDGSALTQRTTPQLTSQSPLAATPRRTRDTLENSTRDLPSLSYIRTSPKRERQNTPRVVFTNVRETETAGGNGGGGYTSDPTATPSSSDQPFTISNR